MKSQVWKKWGVPEFYLFAAGAAALLCTAYLNGLQPVYFSDSYPYIALGKSSWFSRAGLSDNRTLGYPIFLWLCSFFGSAERAVPYFQYAVLFAAVGGFYRSLLAFGIARWRASWMASALFPLLVYFEMISPVMVATDSLGVYMAIGAIAAALRTAAPKAATRHWCILGGVVFLTYQVRPAYLPLLLEMPLLGLLTLALTRSAKEYRQAIPRYLVTGLSVTVLPYIAFCTLRLIVVGHFGLVSFGAKNLIGIAGQFLEETTVAELPVGLQPFAREMLVRRADPAILANYQMKEYTSPLYGRYGVMYRTLHDNYNYVIWQVAQPIGEKMYGGDNVAINRLFGSFSKAMIRLRPIHYATAVAKAYGRSLMIVVTSMPFLFCLIGLAGTYSVYLAARLALVPVPNTWRVSADSARAFHLACVAGLLFFVCQTLIVSLVEAPVDRYILPAAVLMPVAFCALASWIVDQFEGVSLTSRLRWRAGRT